MEQHFEDNDNAALEHLSDYDDWHVCCNHCKRPLPVSMEVLDDIPVVPDDEFGTIDGKPMLILGGECE